MPDPVCARCRGALQTPEVDGHWTCGAHGRVEAGETLGEACVRELREETGLDVVAGDVVGRLERPSPSGATYVIDDLACTVVGGALVAGDDADDARWVTRSELAAMPLTPDLLETLDGWGVLTDLR